MNPVVHFELPAEDKKRMKAFYERAFSWKLNQLGPEMGDYVVAHTTETDEHNMVKMPGAINGGFFTKNPDHPHPSVVIAVEHMGNAMKRVTEAGGVIVGASRPGEPDLIPGVGLYVSFRDTEGNLLSARA